MRRWPVAALAGAVLLLLALAICLSTEHRPAPVVAPDLETAAVTRGLVADPRDRDIVGLYARDTDRLCIVRAEGGYRIGASVDYGDRIACSAAGTVARSGAALRIALSPGCAFSAQYDGEAIRFPARLPPECRAFCTRRATLGALHADRLSGSASEAAAMRTATGKLPCGS